VKKVRASTLVEASQEQVFAFHNDPMNLTRILPTYLRIDISDPPSRLREGALLQCNILLGPLRFEWKTEVTEYSPPRHFVDVQREGPFEHFSHTHTFEANGNGTRLIDVVEFELPPGSFTELASRIGLSDRIIDVLQYGQKVTKALIEKKKP
jgi:ligand-binding SRPBCC domain-containing protein